MAENTKKFLDFTGLQKYDELLKAKVAGDIKVVKDDLDTRKVKDTANSDTITWSKGANGTYTASVAGNVVVDAEYQTVKTKATNSAAAWTKFLEGSNVAYPDGITPALKDLATTASVTKAISDGDASTLAAAKSYTDGKVDGKFDAAGAADQALKDAKAYTDGKVDGKFDTVGSAAQALKDAKDYADSLASNYDAKGAAATAEQNAKDYADGLASNYDAAGAAAQALADAKTYADTNFDAKGSAATAKSEAISEANTYTNGEIKKVDDQIKAINTSIAGGVHFRGVVTTLPVSPFTGYTNGDIVIVGNKEYILNKPTGSEGAWAELGDTTAESQRITALEGDVNTLMGDENTTGSVNNAIKVAKAFTTSEINTLVNSGQVKSNTNAIAVLNGAETVEGSVAKAVKGAKDYADTKKKEATDYTDAEILELVGSTGQVGKNTAAIATLNGNASTEGSVDFKIAQAVSNIEASIDTITPEEINGLFA